MRKIAVIGAGPAGIESASILARENEVLLFEKSATALSNILDKAYLFPDFSSASEIADSLNSKLINENIKLMLNTEVVDIVRNDSEWKIVDKSGKNYFVDAVLITTGYQTFDATRKEELGYGIYKGVVTSIDMERMIKYNQIVNSINESPKRVVFLQCVGSRDEKSGNRYCSKVCCVTAVKQAIEVRKMLPEAEIYIFYMDLRMWGQHFEELYRESQEKYDIRYVRGRISEASSTFDRKIQIKAEDTLLGVPLKMTTDLLVLMVGMEASCGTRDLGKKCGIDGEYGFVKTSSPHLNDNETAEKGLFVAGSCKRPMTINDVLNDARSAACIVMEYLR
ncbi:MAG: CoB--CoM heterodisulfide reductase iron-sulfur subunit A family protein [Bacteroidales bacterium]|jgi:heterodisulfide reductase subunit A|nr:CoB--CoM heterodisulfide reductase iron-sulfur subunit A family protein [Bacteroidales bacterium]